MRDIMLDELTDASVAFLLEHRRYPGCTMASLTIREWLADIEAAVRDATTEAVALAALRPYATFSHRSTCKSYGFGLGGGSRKGYPCTCGLAAALAATGGERLNDELRAMRVHNLADEDDGGPGGDE